MGLFSGSKDERVESFLYSSLSHSFGLPSSFAMDFGHSKNLKARQSPLQVQWSNYQIRSFSITGPQLIPQFFMNEDNYNVYTRIDRDFTFPKGKRMAYDFSRIQEGTLSGQLEWEGSPVLQASDECRKLLNLIYHSGINRWHAIPLVYAETGPIYATTGIPDRIYLQLSTVGEPSANFRQTIMSNVYHMYNLASYPTLEIKVEQDRATASMNFQTFIKQAAPVQPVEPEFPYGYYHSIGLIDNEGMVTIDSILGPVRIPANSDEGRGHLLRAGQEESSAEKSSEPTTQEIPIIELIEEFMERNRKYVDTEQSKEKS